MDRILSAMKATKWAYAPHDPDAVAEMTRRLTAAARNGSPARYSDVVAGVSFHLPNVAGGRPFTIDVHAWRDVDRAIVGDFLGYISMESYEQGGFMLSALAVSADNGEPDIPSRHFFDWARTVGVLHGYGQDAELTFWIEQVKKAQAWAQGLS